MRRCGQTVVIDHALDIASAILGVGVGAMFGTQAAGLKNIPFGADEDAFEESSVEA